MKGPCIDGNSLGLDWIDVNILVVVLYYTTVLQDVTPGKVWIKGTLYFAVLFLTIANKKFN